MIAELGNSEGFRLVGYGLAALACLHAWRWERQVRPSSDRDWYPAFWVWSAFLFAAIGVLRVSGLVEALGDAGREQAQVGGWYEQRRALQAGVVGLVAAIWLAATIVAVWRVPERRRRYLPMMLVALFIIAFGIVRAVSLHHVDTVLYRRDIADIRVVVWIEVGACLLAVAVALGSLCSTRLPWPTRKASTE